MILAFNEDRQSEQTFSNEAEFDLACRMAKLRLIEKDYKKVESVDSIIVEEIIPTEIKETSKVIKEPQIEIEEIIPIKTKKIEDIEMPKNVNILNKHLINEYTVSSFREKLKDFADEELRVFINFDKRQTIINEAKKELKKRK